MDVPGAGGRELDAVVVVGPGRDAEIGNDHRVVAAGIPALIADDLVVVVDVGDVAAGALESRGSALEVAAGVDEGLVGRDVAAVLAAGDGVPAVAGMVGEGPVFSHFLALEDHGDAGRGQVDGGGQQRAFAGPIAGGVARVDQLGQAGVAVEVAGGVVGFHIEDAAETGGAFDQAGQGVHVAVGVAGIGDHGAQVVEEIHVPARIESPGGVAVFLDGNHVGIAVVEEGVDFLHEADAVAVLGPGAFGVFVVADVVGGIRAEAVDVEGIEPGGVAILNVVADFRVGIIGAGGAPRGAAQAGGIVVVDAAVVDVGGIAVELPGGEVRGAPVIVNDIENHGDLACVAGIDEPLEFGRSAVGAFDGVGIGGVVAPTIVAGEFGDGHQFDGVDAEFLQVVEPVGGHVEGAVGGVDVAGAVGQDMHFIDHHVLAFGAGEGAHVPGIAIGIEDDAVAAGVDHAEAARILAPEIAVDDVLVFRARGGIGGVRRPVAIAFAGQFVGRHVPAVEIAGHRDVRGMGRPYAEGDAVAVGNRPHAGPGGLGGGRLRGTEQEHAEEQGNGEPLFHGDLMG